MRLLGIDYGHKKIGIAISDEEGKFAFPLTVLRNDDGIIESIKEICQEKNVSKIILGQSLDYKNRPNPIMKMAEKFKGSLEMETGIGVEYHPEVLSTKEAERIQGSGEMTDASAAAIILKSFIDSQNMVK